MSTDSGRAPSGQALVAGDQAASRLAPTGFDPSRGAKILPVIHYADDNQAMRNAERAFAAGCEGVLLIEMRGRNLDLPFAAKKIKARWPERIIGLNFLNALCASELPLNYGLDATWTDEQLTHSAEAPWMEARRAQKALANLSGHSLFCGVAFKYQRHEPNPALAARRAVDFGLIPTTSGSATGAAADPTSVVFLRDAIGQTGSLAIASGVTPDNADAYLPYVSHVLVSTGVSASFHEFDVGRLSALVAVRNAIAAATGTAKTPQAVECEASQSGPKGIAR